MARKKTSAIKPTLDAPEEAKSSDRSFGIVFALALTIIGVWPVLDGRTPRLWALVLACAFALAATFAPWFLRPLNALWMRFGELLHRLVTPPEALQWCGSDHAAVTRNPNPLASQLIENFG